MTDLSKDADVRTLAESVDGLQRVAAELLNRSSAQDLVLKRIEAVANDNRKNRIGLQIGTVGIILSLAVGAFAIYLFVRLNATTHQVQQVQDRTSSEILCPLWAVFALSIKTNPPPVNYTAEQLELRQHAADAILSGMSKLGCPAT
jgi:hypothetical protein